MTRLTVEDPQRRARLAELTGPPPIAWKTVSLMVSCLIVLAASVIAALAGALPLIVACLINSVVVYLLFSVIHDSIHRAISTNIRFNDWCGRIASMAMSPGTTLGLFRWGHIQHHRHTSGPGDPDNWLHDDRAWILPMKWAFIDVYYLIFTIKSRDRVARRYLPAALMGLGVLATAVVTLLALDYWLELLMLWFLPTRILGITLGFTFFWLPHVPHEVSAAQDPYRATTIRRGLEWLMTPVLQHQNYHLIHHLYPRTPFYNNLRVWRLIEPELRQHELAVQHGFDIHPTIEAARP